VGPRAGLRRAENLVSTGIRFRTVQPVVIRYTDFFLPLAQDHLVGQSFLVIEASRSHSDTTHSVELLWTSDQSVAETST